MRLIKTKELIIYCCFALIFILFAALGEWDSTDMALIFSQPFVSLGSGIRHIGPTSLLFAYILYILIGITPLIFPLIRAIKTKKVFLRDIAWLVLSAFLFVILYFCINPHKIQFVLFGADTPAEAKEAVRNITLLGFSITAYAILLFALLCEAHAKLKQKENRIYIYAKILFALLIIGVLFNLLFIGLYNTKATIKALPQDVVDSININKPINIFAIIFAFVLKIAPAFFTILLFLQSKNFISNMQTDAFSKNNIPKLNSIIKTCTTTIFVSLGAVIAENLVYMLLLDKLLNYYYNIAIPVVMILATCLILIFSKILIRAIVINEENKLVI